jgi:hypothetical protein
MIALLFLAVLEVTCPLHELRVEVVGPLKGIRAELLSDFAQVPERLKLALSGLLVKPSNTEHAMKNGPGALNHAGKFFLPV